ncbi:hypothetical protein WMY93_033391, partial [Mugilogobius chulae]
MGWTVRGTIQTCWPRASVLGLNTMSGTKTTRSESPGGTGEHSLELGARSVCGEREGK